MSPARRPPTPPARRSRTAHWKRWLTGGVAVVVALAVGGPFVYIHLIEGTPPAPLTLSSDTASPTTTAAGTASSSTTVPAGSDPIDGTWKVATGSTAGYRVGEVLLGQSTTAVGRTSSVTGTVTIERTTVSAAAFSVDLTTVKSDQSRRDAQFQGRIMDTADHPTATFTLTKPITLATLPASGVTISEQVTGNLTLHGTTRSVTFTLTARRNGSAIQVAGSIPIVFATWNIPNPSFAGTVTTQDHGTLEFLLDLASTT